MNHGDMSAGAADPTTKHRILVVDDHHPTASMLQISIEQLGGDRFEVTCAHSGQECLALMARNTYDLVLLDIFLGDMSAPDVIAQAQASRLESSYVLISGVENARETVENLETASDFLLKPINAKTLRHLLDRHFPPEGEAKEQSWRERFAPDIVGQHRSILQMLLVIERVAPSTSTILITGEAGTGKELVARAVHSASTRAGGPFFPINVTATGEALFESSLFGWAKGAFTGATGNRAGFFEEADQGTIFLDEVGDLPLHQQPKLLRVLQSGKFYRVGEQKERFSNARVVAATNQDLAAMVADGKFRNDLYWRLNVIPIHVPALRDRASDIPELAEHFLLRSAQANNTQPLELSADGREWLMSRPWPGNIRELEHSLRRVSLLHWEGPSLGARDLARYLDPEGSSIFQSVASPGSSPKEEQPASPTEPAMAPVPLQPEPAGKLPRELVTTPARDSANSSTFEHQDDVLRLISLPKQGLVLKDFQEKIEVKLIWEALRAKKFVRAHAAELLGAHRTTLVEKIKKLAKTYPRLAQESPREDDDQVTLEDLRKPLDKTLKKTP